MVFCTLGVTACAGARVGMSVPIGFGGVGVSVSSDGRVGGSVGVGRGGTGVGVGGTMSLPRNDKDPGRQPPAAPLDTSP
ncbi:hypothetical protein M8A51_15810 [Schlegelella sp. S2-27]|uniref:Uncharacterized protein n=1 Tax=Caldimonas mangrovi TaxID=2944811 RepID=A0ABT0YQI0_9BURK|nr:hypothetical protein [Caldimonas mangrovi]MCM5680991.1 hypothetical protein [Caldimonas mangrovi]